VAGILIWVGARRRLRPGSLALLYLVLYGAGRFLLELLRTDTTYRLFGLSRNAYVSLAVVVGGSVWLYLRERRRPPADGPEEAAPEEAGPEKAAEAEETGPAAEADARGTAEEAPAGGRDEGGGRGGP
jgi:Prolipoprotein diacylglyceryl transferase